MCIIVIKRIVRAQLALKCVIIIFTTNTRLISLSTLIRTSMKKNKQEIWLLLFAARMMDDLFNVFSTQHESIILGNLSIDWIFVLYLGCFFILWIKVPRICFFSFKFDGNHCGWRMNGLRKFYLLFEVRIRFFAVNTLKFNAVFVFAISIRVYERATVITFIML